jgi:hypothetical protein
VPNVTQHVCDRGLGHRLLDPILPIAPCHFHLQNASRCLPQQTSPDFYIAQTRLKKVLRNWQRVFAKKRLFFKKEPCVTIFSLKKTLLSPMSLRVPIRMRLALKSFLWYCFLISPHPFCPHTDLLAILWTHRVILVSGTSHLWFLLLVTHFPWHLQAWLPRFTLPKCLP